MKSFVFLLFFNRFKKGGAKADRKNTRDEQRIRQELMKECKVVRIKDYKKKRRRLL